MGDPIIEHEPINRRAKNHIGATVAVRFGNIEEIGYEAARTDNYAQVWMVGTYDVKLCSIPKCRIRSVHRHAYTMPECEL